MLTTDHYVAVVEANVTAIAAAAEGHLAQPVEHCPGFDVGRLLEHTGGFCRIVEARVARDEEWVPASGSWYDASAEAGSDPLGWHREWGAALCRALRVAPPAERVRTWAGSRTRYFWFRRATQELTIHRFDVEHAVGVTTAIDPVVALDGMDEFLGEFGQRAAALFAGAGETLLFIAEDIGAAFSVTAYADRLDIRSPNKPTVEARGTAQDLCLFLWGRLGPAGLRVEGDDELIERWHDRVRI